MSRPKDRPGRKSRIRAALLLAASLLALGAVPAEAGMTGGAATDASTRAATGGGLSFTALRWAGATWYGPGLYGNRTACGHTLLPGTRGVAHRSLPCGARIKFIYRGRRTVTQVIDRGPYSFGNDWDLTEAVARDLGFLSVGVDDVGFAVARADARKHRAKRAVRR